MSLVTKTFQHLGPVLAAGFLFAQVTARGETDAATPADPAVRELIEQNRQLQQRVTDQQRQIDELRARLDHLPTPTPPPPPPSTIPAKVSEPEPAAPDLAALSDASHQVRISGEVSLAFFSGGPDSAYPNSEFGVDDARLFVEAPVWRNVYFFGGLELKTRESGDDYFHLGELYVDVDDVFDSARDRRLNLRLGRFNIPFGEEYQYRSVMTDPLISHSLADLWGYDSGIEVYGRLGDLQYNVALQNGGVDKNKSATARLGYNPVKSLHLSLSAHHTGRLSEQGDYLSPIWFGGAFFRGLAPIASSHIFEVTLLEADAVWKWKDGHVGANLGEARFDDDDPLADNFRRMHFGSLELVQQITGGLFGAVRYSEIRAPRGYPIMGQANGGKYFYNPYAPLTTDLERLSLGLGYQFGPPFVWKVEYSWENGRLVGGLSRNNEDLLSTEIGIRF